MSTVREVGNVDKLVRVGCHRGRFNGEPGSEYCISTTKTKIGDLSYTERKINVRQNKFTAMDSLETIRSKSSATFWRSETEASNERVP